MFENLFCKADFSDTADISCYNFIAFCQGKFNSLSNSKYFCTVFWFCIFKTEKKSDSSEPKKKKRSLLEVESKKSK